MISYDTLRTILTMSITGSILAVILFAFKPLIRNRLPKSAQYYLWLVVLAALVVPISRLVILPDSTFNVPTISKTVDWYVVSNEDIFDRIKPYETEDADGFIGIPESSMAEVDALVPDTWVPEAVDWFRLIHYLGVAAYLAFIYCSYVVFAGKMKQRNTVATAEEYAILAELCGKYRVPALYRNPLAATPMLIGVFHPAITLPDKEYSDTQLRAVLLHELTHLRRKDVLVKWLSVIVTAVHWFNPIVWLVRHEIDRACELSCDEAVIRNLDTDGKQNYGETLLYVAADSKTPKAVLSTTMCEEKKALKERLGAIMKSKKHTRLAVIVSAVLIFVIGGMAIVLGAGRSANIESTTNRNLQYIGFNGFSLGGTVSSDMTATLTLTDRYTSGEYDYNYEEVRFSLDAATGVIRKLWVNVSEIGVVCSLDDTTSRSPWTTISQIRGYFGEGKQGWQDREQKLRYVEYIQTQGRLAAKLRFVYADDEYDRLIWVIVESNLPYSSPTNGIGQLSLDDIRAFAAKGDALQYTDLPFLRPSMLSSTMGGYNPTLYGVEGGYRLLINFNDTMNPESGISSTALESIWESGGSGIDIRYGDVDEFIRTHPSHPADSTPPTSYTPREWINRQNLDYSLTTTVDLMLDEFPDVLFSYTPERLTATNKNKEKELFGGTDGFIFGGYIDNLYLADLNGDGLPEFCGTTNYGSGFGDSRVIVYDYANDKRYVLSDRGTYDYFLQMENGQLEVIQTEPMQMSNMPRGVGSLAIINGELVIFGINRATPSVDPQPTTPPTHSPFMSSWKPLHELPIDYSTEQAVADNVYVNIHGSKIYNQIMVDQFYADVYSGGGAAFLRVMLYTIEGDAILVDYQYDGEMFTVTHDSTRDKFGAREITTYNYKYLVADDRSVTDGQPMSYYLSNEKNIYAGAGNALIERIWQLPSPSMQNERAPQIEVVLTMNGFPEQRIEAAQLTTSWSYIDENGNSVGYEADSPHALQLDNYNDITLRLNGSNGEISFIFSGSYKPQSVSVQRWDAVYYMGRHYIESAISQNESVTVNGNTLRINNDGNDYIYEVYAVYEQGSSYYAFRVNASN